MPIKIQFDMGKIHKIHIFILFAFLILAAHCGRKQKNVFSFPQKDNLQINKLDLPAVKGLVIQKTNLGTHISWLPLFSEKTSAHLKHFEKNFVGFNVFRLENNAMFIPKNPINKKNITSNFFIDSKIKRNKNASYMVQPIFRFENKLIGGPSSQIINMYN